MHLSRIDINPETKIVGTLLSLENVYDRGHGHNHVPEDLRLLLEESLFTVDSGEADTIERVFEFDEIIGTTDRVVTTPSDKIILALRNGRLGPTRFVLDRDPEPTNKMTVVLGRHRSRAGAYILKTAFLGGLSSPEPWDPSLRTAEAKKSSAEFWNNHALIFDPESIDLSWGLRDVVRNSQIV